MKNDSALRTRILRIVIMDDEPFVGEAMKIMIRGWFNDATVLTFTDAEKALQELAREVPDLFTTDWNHPKHLCPEMFRLLAAKKTKCPIFVISADSDRVEANGALKEYSDLGLNITLRSKPFTAEWLHGELAKYLGPDNPPQQSQEAEP
jgi:DNA-binding NtrC family response regulator